MSEIDVHYLRHLNTINKDIHTNINVTLIVTFLLRIFLNMLIKNVA